MSSVIHSQRFHGSGAEGDEFVAKILFKWKYRYGNIDMLNETDKLTGVSREGPCPTFDYSAAVATTQATWAAMALSAQNCEW
jgi:hypothetical protein